MVRHAHPRRPPPRPRRCCGGAWVYAGRGGAPASRSRSRSASSARRRARRHHHGRGRAPQPARRRARTGRAGRAALLARQAGRRHAQAGVRRARAPHRAASARSTSPRSRPARRASPSRRPAAVLLGLRTLPASAETVHRVRLEPPRVRRLSMHHFVNLGGAEVVVYRGTPADASPACASATSCIPGSRWRGAGVRPIRRCTSPSSRCSTTRT